MDNRADIRDFLATRRARLTPDQVGLPTSARRRVPGLRREEVAVLAGVSTEWYTRLEKGHIAEVSAEVLDAVAEALRLDEDERTYLHDLARAAKPAHRRTPRRREVPLSPQTQWMLDSVTMSAAFVRNGRLDVIGSNALGRALHAPMFASATTAAHGGVPNFARYHFLDEGSKDFFVDWESGSAATVALLRAEAGRNPDDKPLRELIGELSTASQEFSAFWAAHNIRIRHEGIKRLRHPEVGELELTYQSVTLSAQGRTRQDLSFYTAEPGSADEERLRLLASWTAPGAGVAEQPKIADSRGSGD
ncbi:helix-turn-helix protein [Propionibacteriaceae bacterium ES.041]|uniref:helix-turn-helix domain-containing protein n=1 Tax=Enemella evansiae TaxID=2016499 RepID=UPI000B962F07|nr:helix-turn-helix transcriptional regulator [Enemella evansiae]OYN94685.1 transcriptional regulator [Enemella evansiae]PFG67760.1 helix-turn-helix protein [Propionibacteriaceae bacterium ES.041]